MKVNRLVLVLTSTALMVAVSNALRQDAQSTLVIGKVDIPKDAPLHRIPPFKGQKGSLRAKIALPKGVTVDDKGRILLRNGDAIRINLLEYDKAQSLQLAEILASHVKESKKLKPLSGKGAWVVNAAPYHGFVEQDGTDPSLTVIDFYLESKDLSLGVFVSRRRGNNNVELLKTVAWIVGSIKKAE